MKRIVRSMGFALSGLHHAIREERNIQQFLVGLVVYILIGIGLGFWMTEWIIVTLTAAGFLIVELLNTAIERVGDAIDDTQKTRHSGHYHLGIKQAKDIAAAASLVALLVVVLILGSLLSAHIFMMQSAPGILD